jgi:hypothetical protein
MKAGTRISIAAALAALAIGAATGPASAERAAGGEAAQKASCKITLSLARSTYATYVQSLSVKNTSCGKGWKVVRAFHECRKENGGRDGRCKSRVKGYKCDEGKRTGVPGVRYTAKVSCSDGSKRVNHQYDMSL